MPKASKGLLKAKNKLSKSHLTVFIAIVALIGAFILIQSHAAPNPNLPGDLNNDNTVNGMDLSLLLSDFNTTNPAADINGDGQVNGLDLSTLLGHWGQSYSGGTGTTPGIGVYELGGNLAYLSTPNIYSIVIGDAWDNISTIQNVAGRGLAYFSTVSNPRYSTGIPYTQASSNGWILKCGTADCINPQFGSYGIDLGNTAVQQAWISNIESYLSGHPGIDGVFMDTVIYDPYATFQAYPNKYPDTASWDQAMLSFIKAVHTALNAKGYYTVYNTGAYRPGSSTYNDGSDTITWFKMVGPYTDGMMNEFYDEASGGNYLDKARSTGTAWYQNWDGWQRLIGVTQSMGKDFFGGMYGGCTDTTQMTYGKASFLLEWNGGGSVFAYNGGKACDSTNPAWTKDIGKPSAAKVQVGVGWMRAYTKGTVLVNPSPTTSQTFTVNGTSYTLAPTTARIL